MKFKFWTRPKLVIKKLIVYLSYFCFIILILSLILLYKWNYNPKFYKRIEYDNFHLYTKKMNRIIKSLKNTFDPNKKRKLYLNLLQSELSGMTYLHQFYHLVQESYEYIINEYITEKEYEKAENLAFEWQQKYPYDFNAKFFYIEVLTQTSPEKLFDYYQELYNSYKSIDIVVFKYIDFLVQNNMMDKACEISEQLSSNFIDSVPPQFSVQPKDSENQEIKFFNYQQIQLQNYTSFENQYSIDIKLQVTNFHGLFFNISNIKAHTYIDNIDASIETNGKTFPNLKINQLYDITNNNSQLEIISNSPVLDFKAPKQLLNYSGELKVQFNFKIKFNKYFLLKQCQKISPNYTH